ncbi:MAG TPA: FAD/NAD(P)-binding oxidoreductase [Gemmatimonadales bacterium]|nr:FAD/NAD(P)-binding oxidoreductase [Gemmatimonadales bacterium]
MRERADVVVIGAGPAGIAAACGAAPVRRVVMLDGAPGTGGQIWRHRTRATLGRTARRWLARLDRSGVEFRGGVSVTEVGRGRIGWTSRRGHGVIDAETIVLATGAREHYLPFPGWTLPGVMGVGGLQAFIKNGMSVSGLRIVLAGSGPLLLPVAAACVEAGAEVVCIVEQAPARQLVRFGAGLWRHPWKIVEAARYRLQSLNVPLYTGSWVQQVTSSAGQLVVERAASGDVERIRCDILAAGFGLVPNTELAQLAGCAVEDGRVRVNERQETSVPGILAAGETTGIAGADAALVEGRIAGSMAAGRAASEELPLARRAGQQQFAAALQRDFALRRELLSLASPETIICRCEDVRRSALDASWDARHAKLMTRAGMGPCQGRVCAPAMAALFGWDFPAVRLPALPASVAALCDHCATITHVEAGA